MGTYIQRLRLEYIAFKLITTDVSVPKLLDQINYQNKHTLSRAFKKLFQLFHSGISQKAFKRQFRKEKSDTIEPSIEKISGIRIAYLKWKEQIMSSIASLFCGSSCYNFPKKYELSSKRIIKYVSLTLDYPYITPEEQSRFMIGVTLPQSFGSRRKALAFMKFMRENMQSFVSKGFIMN